MDETDRQLLKLLCKPDGLNAAMTNEAKLIDRRTSDDDRAEAWQKFVERAAELSVSPLVFDALRRSNHQEAVPLEILQQLQGDCHITALLNMLIYRRLHTLLQMLQTHKIDVILLKGVFLAQMVYRDVGLRPMSDIDLMVRPTDVERVRHLMMSLGFTCESGPTTEGSGTGETNVQSQELHHDCFSHAGYNLDVEIHWGLVKASSRFQIDTDALWQQATATQVAGLPAYLLSPVDTLLHQCIHVSYQHVFQRYSLRSLCDIQRLIEHYGNELDWHQLCERAAIWRGERSTYLALLLAQKLLHAGVPPFVLEDLRPAHFDERLYCWAVHRVLGKVADMEGPWSSNTGRWYLAGHWSEKLKIAAQICFPPPQKMANEDQVRNNTPFLWTGYLRHWGKLARTLLSARSQRKLGKQDETTISWNEREIGRTALTAWLHETPNT